MSSLSESAFCAGWIQDLEHYLWRAVTEGPFRYGHLDITNDHVKKLLQLSTDCDGWIYFDDSTEETYMPMRRWLSEGYQHRRSG